MPYKDPIKQKQAKHESYLRHKEIVRQRTIDARRRNKDYVYKIKSTACCKYCLENHASCLDFHHLKDKIYNIADIIHDGAGLQTLKDEIEKCIILCGNCHAKEHRPEKILVHCKGLNVARINKRAWYAEFVTTQKCLLCNESDYRCLEFHHRNPSEKNFCISYMLTSGHSLEVFKKEIDKCDVLCVNCHRKHHKA